MKFLLVNLLFCWAINLISSQGNKSYPKIFGTWNSHWTNGTTASGDRLYYSLYGANVTIYCKAPYPVQWNIVGAFNEAKLAYIDGQVDFLNEVFRIYFTVNFHGHRNFRYISSQITCERAEGPSVQASVYMFVSGHSIPELDSKTGLVENSKLIPCIYTNPFSPPELHLMHKNKSLERVSNVEYNPAKGFLSETIFEGKYICKNPSQMETIIAFRDDPDYELFPTKSDLEYSTEETFTINCTSKRGDLVRLEVEDELDFKTVHFYLAPNNSSQAVMISPKDIEVSEDSFDITLIGHAKCIEVDSRNRSRVVKQWNFIFYDPVRISVPENQSSIRSEGISCESKSNVYYLATVKCRDSYDCRFRTKCFRDRSSTCYLKQGKNFNYEYSENYTKAASLSETDKFLGIASNKFVGSGIARCVLENGYSAWKEFFQSLSLRTYYSYKNAPLEELVRIDEVQDILHVNKVTVFTCHFVEYLFMRNVIFELEYRNGSTQGFSVAHGTQNFSSVDYNLHIVEGGHGPLVLKINQPDNAVAVHCKAMFPNSTEVITSTKRFQTRYLQNPSMKGNGTVAETIFTRFQQSARLICPGHGEPTLTYEWQLRDVNGIFRDVSETFVGLISGTDSNGEGYLEFPVAFTEHSGDYKCIGKNEVDQVEKEIKLTVQYGFPIQATVIAALGATTIALVAIAAAFVLFWRRSKNWKQQLRDLEDQEIEEFKYGRPELCMDWRDGTHPVEMIECIPYKTEYEIPLENIAFGQTDKNFLGSGEFSYVVKASILPSLQEAAVKITKATVDVSVFKSLLSEIKIMIYVGDHENIVKLIGVCTERIQYRCVYIATEICENGSLDKFLINARHSFTNIIGKDQRLERAKIPKSNGTGISTLDLIRFAAEIATGMEHLELKSIVHADLAARNVLISAGNTVKISDFGLSRKLYSNKLYVKKTKCPLAWRWMALETLAAMTFSAKSDVWSYGVTLYEVFSLGDKPFPNEKFNEKFLLSLKNGVRLGKPNYCTDNIYKEMQHCWESQPKNRPNFFELRKYFESVLADLRQTGSKKCYGKL